jgi:hypothetical protein
MALTSSNSPPATLMGLPVEVRLQIFNGAAITPQISPYYNTSGARYQLRCGLRVTILRPIRGSQLEEFVRADVGFRGICKQTRAEMTDMIYENSVFRVEIDKRGPLNIANTTDLSFLVLVRHLRIEMSSINFQNCSTEAALLGRLMSRLTTPVTQHQLEFRFDTRPPLYSPARTIWNQRVAQAHNNVRRTVQGNPNSLNYHLAFARAFLAMMRGSAQPRS